MNLELFFKNIHTNNDSYEFTKGRIIKRGTVFYICFCILSLIFIALVSKIYMLFGIDVDSLDNDLTSMNVSKPLLFFLLCIYAPIVEEAMFRLPLTFKKTHVAISLALITITLFTFLSRLFSSAALSVFSFIAGIIVFILILNNTTQYFWYGVKIKYGRKIIWASIIIFALLHISNYESCELVYVPYLLSITLPRFFLAMSATYFRINRGYWTAVKLHFINNCIAALALFLSDI